jgi:hypothetical protein
MTQPSEERVPDNVESLPTPARVVPFERPQSELQRAVQQRAQETIDRERERAAQARPKPWFRGLMLALAAIPVFVLFSSAISFIGALRQFNVAVFESIAGAVQNQGDDTPNEGATADQSTGPSTPVPSPADDSAEVVMIQPYSIKPDAPRDDGKSQ